MAPSGVAALSLTLVLPMSRTATLLIECRARSAEVPPVIKGEDAGGDEQRAPDGDRQELAEAQEVEGRRDDLEDGERQDQPADLAEAAVGVGAAEHRGEDGDQQ